MSVFYMPFGIISQSAYQLTYRIDWTLCRVPVTTDSKKVSLVGLEWKNPLKDTQNLQNPSLRTFLSSLITLMVTKGSKMIFVSTGKVPRILKWYHMLSWSEQIPIKKPKIHQNPSLRTFLRFLIILMMTKGFRMILWVLARCQGF